MIVLQNQNFLYHSSYSWGFLKFQIFLTDFFGSLISLVKISTFRIEKHHHHQPGPLNTRTVPGPYQDYQISLKTISSTYSILFSLLAPVLKEQQNALGFPTTLSSSSLPSFSPIILTDLKSKMKSSWRAAEKFPKAK